MSDDKKKPGRPNRPSRPSRGRKPGSPARPSSSRRGPSLGKKIGGRSGAKSGQRRPAGKTPTASRRRKSPAAAQAAALRRARQQARLQRARQRAGRPGKAAPTAAVTGAAAGAAAAAAAANRAARRRPARRNTARRNVARSVSPEVQVQIDAVQDKFAKLEAAAQLPDVYDAIGKIEGHLTELPLRLESLRRRGYVHGGQLDDKLLAFDEQWDDIDAKVDAMLEQQVARLDKEMGEVERRVDGLSAGSSSAISQAERATSSLERQISTAAGSVSSTYDSVLNELTAIDHRLNHVEWMLGQFETAAEIELVETEAPLEAVEAEWHENGKEGPEGILLLTDQRLLFEQREEKSTKKLFGMVKTDSETIQRLRLDIPASSIDTVKASEEGGFLGMGKEDILELTCGADAPVARARFHIKGQESADWTALIKRVKSGEIDEDRDDDFVEEVEAAMTVAGTFPAECPSCFAPVPPPGRGVSSVTCEFCGATIIPS